MTSCISDKPISNITIDWNNDLMLPPCNGMDSNVGLAGVYSGFIGDKLVVLGGANFPVGYPWTGGKKTWWPTLYSYDTTKQEWKVFDGFLDKPLGYGVSIQLSNGLLCIGGCDANQCYSDVFLIQNNGESFSMEKDMYPSLPVPLANASGILLDNKIYIIGGQESMQSEKSTKHFFVLDLNDKNKGWDKLPEWPGASRGYSICVAQGGKIFMFSGRSYGPDEETIMHMDGHSFDPVSNVWNRLSGEFPVMAGTAMAYEEDKILFMGGVEEILPTTPEHPGFSNKVRIYDIKSEKLDRLTTSPYPIPVTSKIVTDGDEFYISSGEVKPGIRTPHILKGIIKQE